MNGRCVALALLTLAVPCAALGAPFAVPPPPKPVECADKSKCDPAADGVAGYVSAFYDWYFSSRIAVLAEIGQDNSASNNRKRDVYFAALGRNVASALSPGLKRLVDKQASAMDGDKSSPFCRDTDADVLTCLLDPPDKVQGSAKASLVKGDGRKATFAVALPAYQYGLAPRDEVHSVDATTISVTLAADKGVWKIDKVTDTGVKP
jgi:hypothetical protein